MKFTLLEIVQEILSAMDSDEVNSIDDTIESYQVALIVRSVFYDLAIDLGLPEHETLFQLEPSGDPDKPVLMYVPTNVSLVRNIKYNIQEADEDFANYRSLDYRPFEEFITEQSSLNTSESDVGEVSITPNGIDAFKVMYRTNEQPRNYTTFDDYTFIFNAYDSTLDTTLQKSKTLCMGVVYPTFDLVDTFTPDIDPPQFSLLKNRAKVRAFSELKQQQNQEASQEARRQKIIVQKRKITTPRLPDVLDHPRRFGRKGAMSSNLARNLKQNW